MGLYPMGSKGFRNAWNSVEQVGVGLGEKPEMGRITAETDTLGQRKIRDDIYNRLSMAGVVCSVI